MPSGEARRSPLRSSQFGQTPGFTAVVVLTLALGLSFATTAFTVLNALLLRPLPLVQHQDRMPWINEAIPSKDVERTKICYADFGDLRPRTQTVDAVWIYDTRTVILGGTEAPERLTGAGLTAGAFRAMGVPPIRGRDFLPGEYEPRAGDVVLLGDDRYGVSPHDLSTLPSCHSPPPSA